MKKIILYSILAVILLSSVFTMNYAFGDDSSKCTGTALCITEKITRIIDGDTLYTKKYKIRLSLVNSPEKNQTGFAEAKSFTSKLCPVGSTITINQDDNQPYDKYKRLVGKIFCGNKVLNSELVYNNHLVVNTFWI